MKMNLLKFGWIAMISIGVSIPASLDAQDVIIRRGFGRELGRLAISEDRQEEPPPKDRVRLQQETLQANGIERNAESIGKYLRDSLSEDYDKKKVNELIAQLGNEVYSARIQAQRELIRLPQLPIEPLTKALRSENREVAYRAKIVLDNGIPERERVLRTVVTVVQEEKIKGVCRELLELAELFADNRGISIACRRALLATAAAVDEPIFRKALDSDSKAQQRLAMACLRKTAKGGSADEFLAWAEDKSLDGIVRFEAAIAGADMGNRRSIPVLIELMENDNINLRAQANTALKKFTGQNFLFAAYDKLPSRTAKIAKWREWFEGDGQEAKLYFPLAEIRLARSNLNGNMLVAMGYRNKVIEYSPDGKEVWSFDAQGAWSAEKMENGNVLIAAYQEGRVIEVSPEKKVVWEHKVPGVLNARPLENGNVLISSHSGQTVTEVTHGGEEVWKYKADRNCHDAIRLENGNTVIALDHKVIEVDKEKEIVWEYDAKQAYGIDVLENGNVLIAQLAAAVIEVDRQTKKIVWQYDGKQVADVFRLENGNTLIVNSTKCFEVTPDKKVVWEKENFNYGTARR